MQHYNQNLSKKYIRINSKQQQFPQSTKGINKIRPIKFSFQLDHAFVILKIKHNINHLGVLACTTWSSNHVANFFVSLSIFIHVRRERMTLGTHINVLFTIYFLNV